MNQLTSSEMGYPFLFFPSEAFYKEQVTNYIVDLYEQMTEGFNNEILSLGTMSSIGVSLYKTGIIARICQLDEDNDGFMMVGLSEYARELYKETSDFIWIADQFELFPMDPDKQKLFQHDIAKALEMRHMCFFKAECSYELMHYKGVAMTEENIEKYFINLPSVKVW